MLKPIDIKKYKLEIMKVTTAKAEMEFKIEERLEDISRLRDQMKLQDDRVAELQKLLDQE